MSTNVTVSDITQIEAWAASGYTGTGSVRVRGRGTHVHVEEELVGKGGKVSYRTLVRLRRLATTGAWTVHRATAAGRWIEDGLSGDLGHVLDNIDLRKV